MAISEDTAAIVAGQLTQAWATIFAQNDGAGGLADAAIASKVKAEYRRFLNELRHQADPSGS